MSLSDWTALWVLVTVGVSAFLSLCWNLVPGTWYQVPGEHEGQNSLASTFMELASDWLSLHFTETA